jgi:exoribonuclease II
MDFTDRIIAFFDGSDLKIIHVEEESKNKLAVRTERGRQFRIPVKNVLLDLESATYDGYTSRYESLVSEIATKKEDVETKLLWEMIEEDIKEYDLLELADHYFGDGEKLAACALFNALLADTIHFKRKGIGFTPRSAEQVDEQQQIVKRKKEREEFRERIIPWLEASLLQEKIEDTPAEFGPFLNLLEVFLSNRKDNDSSRIFASVLGKKPLKDAVYELLMKTGRLNETDDRYLVLAGISEKFSQRITEDAEQQKVIDLFDGREDLTHLTTFSIDDESTMDIDDALSIERTDSGFRVGVHITDVSAAIIQGEVLDTEASNRVTSIYLPDRTVNMFPKMISQDICSLVAGQDRAAMSFLIDFDENFEQVDFAVKLSKVNTDAKLSYNSADELLTLDETYSEDLKDLHKIALELQQERISKGAAIFNRPELKISVENGQPDVSVMDRNSASRFLVSEFMVLANSIAARFSARHDVPIIYRVQDTPEGLPELDPDVYDPILFEQAIKCMRKSRLSLHPQSHGGLGADFYTQLTSPIRRYTDLIMQRQLAAYLQERPLPYEAEELMAVISAAEAVNADVRDVQRQAENYWLHLYVENIFLEKTLEATVISKAPGGYMIELDEIFYKTRMAIQDKKQPGDRIEVRVDKVKPRQSIMQLVLQSG